MRGRLWAAVEVVMLGRRRRADKAVSGEIVMSLDWTPVRGSVVGGTVSVPRSLSILQTRKKGGKSWATSLSLRILVSVPREVARVEFVNSVGFVIESVTRTAVTNRGFGFAKENGRTKKKTRKEMGLPQKMSEKRLYFFMIIILNVNATVLSNALGSIIAFLRNIKL